jgi:hypothetical protein
VKTERIPESVDSEEPILCRLLLFLTSSGGSYSLKPREIFPHERLLGHNEKVTYRRQTMKKLGHTIDLTLTSTLP